MLCKSTRNSQRFSIFHARQWVTIAFTYPYKSASPHHSFALKSCPNDSERYGESFTAHISHLHLFFKAFFASLRKSLVLADRHLSAHTGKRQEPAPDVYVSCSIRNHPHSVLFWKAYKTFFTLLFVVSLAGTTLLNRSKVKSYEHDLAQ